MRLSLDYESICYVAVPSHSAEGIKQSMRLIICHHRRYHHGCHHHPHRHNDYHREHHHHHHRAQPLSRGNGATKEASHFSSSSALQFVMIIMM